MKFINAIVILASVALAAPAPVAEHADEAKVEKRCDHDALAKCILACNVTCVATGPAGIALCTGSCLDACKTLEGQGDC
ncbi:hypothetical protein FZEAL_10536 [Fusarium zealandicum]|uniref:Uncharacterized protein n=1 Tax=Fusarium zealandicum TaxID=1053134 RepID=A0A8H4U0F7_9HYPO|nr:hypothetical protein FZEAL_10536 [Fusarium zealandicum]